VHLDARGSKAIWATLRRSLVELPRPIPTRPKDYRYAGHTCFNPRWFGFCPRQRNHAQKGATHMSKMMLSRRSSFPAALERMPAS
jgi:hypothetical protein